MALVWDERKRRANIVKHSLDFADAYLVFDNPDKLTFASIRNDEERRVDIARVDEIGQCLALIYTERGKDVRVISFRVASRKEREIYERQKESD